MGFSLLFSRALLGLHAPLVTVETHISPGLPRFNIVGLPETAVKESRDRVRSALLTSHFDFPRRRITVNLGPADLPKEGGRFDLAIALGIIVAMQQLPQDGLDAYEFLGELALDGQVRQVTGALPSALATTDDGRQLILPEGNGLDAGVLGRPGIWTAPHLLAVCQHLRGLSLLTPVAKTALTSALSGIDFAQVIGQAYAKRALEIAATGRHHGLFIGPPGTGKSLLASCLPNLLSPLPESQAITVAAIHTLRGMFKPEYFWQRPFRAPHHTCSAVALVGGGKSPQPGEISLAHAGVLFLDELPEFDRRVLESLRQPLEVGQVTIARADYQIQFPAQFQLIAAMNPCPCAYLGDNKIPCHCTPQQIQRYQHKISGPLLDRLDLFVRLSREATLLQSKQKNHIEENSATVQARVIAAQAFALNRTEQAKTKLPKITTLNELVQNTALTTKARQLLEQASEMLHLSPRASFRVLRVSRTIADLATSDVVQPEHLAEALSFRPQLLTEYG